MVMNMRPIQFLIFVIFILASSTQASAAALAVKIINETGNTINITNLFVQDKRCLHTNCSNEGGCLFGLSGGEELRPDAVHRCEMRGMVKKQRSITVQVQCDPPPRGLGGATEIVFPRNRGWFGRKHLKNNNQLYTLKIKASDC
jgi:hypothetical protein